MSGDRITELQSIYAGIHQQVLDAYRCSDNPDIQELQEREERVVRELRSLRADPYPIDPVRAGRAC
jgi:hypothetical protein